MFILVDHSFLIFLIGSNWYCPGLSRLFEKLSFGSNGWDNCSLVFLPWDVELDVWEGPFIKDGSLSSLELVDSNYHLTLRLLEIENKIKPNMC